MDERGSGRESALRTGAISAGVVLGMFAAYQLGLAGGTLAMLIIPIGLAVFVIGTLAAVRPMAPSGATANAIGWERFELEFERSRRYERALALLRIALPPRPGGRQHLDAGAKVREAVRILDAVWTDRDGIIVLMPDTDRDALARAIGRILTSLPGLGLDSMRVALYPDDGLTSGALVARLSDPDAEPEPADIVHLPTQPRDVEARDRTG